MATFVLIHGAGDSGWWHLLEAELRRRRRDQSATPMERPWPLSAWPKVPTRFLACRDDRFLPAEFLHRVVRDRLRITADEMDGSHCVALSHPRSWPTAWRRTEPSSKRPPAGRRPKRPERAAPGDQLHPLVVPHDSQTKHEPAGRIRTPQVEQ
jgi:hypothetical protein